MSSPQPNDEQHRETAAHSSEIMSTDTLTLHSKLSLPYRHVPALERERLHTVLDKGLFRKLTLVISPAGYGKTTLVSRWCSHITQPNMWISLDTGDNGLSRFWQYITAGIQSVLPEFSTKIKPFLHLLHSGDSEMAMVYLLNELSRLAKPLIIVLDDFQFIQEAELRQSFAYFLEFMPSSLHVILISREQPALPLAKMELEQAVLRIEADDMRFTEQEGALFFRDLMKLDLPEQTSRSFVNRTEGWIAAMKLAALAMEKQSAHHVLKELANNHRLFESYLLEEVFHELAPDMQQFLMDCSVLPRLNSSLCGAVSQHQQPGLMLEEALKSGLFLIPLHGTGGWYRFHSLFSAFLLAQFMKVSPGKANERRRRAAEWCMSQHMPEEAIEYWLKAGEYDQVADLLEKMADRTLKREWSTLGTWLAALPEYVLLARPSLHFSYLLTLLFGRQTVLFESELRKMERRLKMDGAQWTEVEHNSVTGNLVLMRSLYSTFNEQNNLAALNNLQHFQAQLPHMGNFILGMFEGPAHPSMLGAFRGQSGQLARSIVKPFLLHIIELVRNLNQPVLAWLYIGLGELHYHWNEAVEAERYLQLGMEAAAQFGDGEHRVSISLPGWIYMAKSLTLQQRSNEAVQYLSSALIELEEHQMEEALIHVQGELARMSLMGGESQPALDWISRWRLSVTDPISIYHLHIYLQLARFLIILGKAEQSLPLIERLEQLTAQEKRPIEAIEASLLHALALAGAGRMDAALLHMGEALHFAEAEGFTSLFVQERTAAAGLITSYLQIQSSHGSSMRNKPSIAYVKQVLRAFNMGTLTRAASQSHFQEGIGLLTPKERLVLTQMTRGYANREIADRMNIGMGTVKTHINRIYSKLGVATRLEAIGKALEAGLNEE
ncbi:LuxR C-terminal-related transcriptional regulator [Paenibacillus pabuli]|uniref:LuxR C-terminal-related transcriptional regulator n=2 Tax=Paenibacillus pabuli TaxID=1472 RepID=UPI00078239F3|nr:LuxR C-terminal-related transcriptional regulator [Paenibacillus pabuli]MEC0124547.1 LuxR C-terminal-related transcriptional regulator [Paenibacillus pabuli]